MLFPLELVNIIEDRLFREVSNFTQIDEIKSALLSESNMILYGPGGYGKSMLTGIICEEFEKYYNNEKSTGLIQLDPGKNISDLIGDISISEFRNNERVIRNVKSSLLFQHDIIILEEAFDARLEVLMALKDIIMRGKISDNHSLHNIKTKLFIICTNINPDEYFENLEYITMVNSTKALFERFPRIIEMKWCNYNQLSYYTLIKQQYDINHYSFPSNQLLKDLSSVVSDMSQFLISKSNLPISPRTVAVALKSLQTVYIKTNNIEECLNAFKYTVKSLLFSEDLSLFIEKMNDVIRKTKNSYSIVGVMEYHYNSFVEEYENIIVNEYFSKIISKVEDNRLTSEDNMFLNEIGNMMENTLNKILSYKEQIYKGKEKPDINDLILYINSIGYKNNFSDFLLLYKEYINICS